MEMFNVRDGLV